MRAAHANNLFGCGESRDGSKLIHLELSNKVLQAAFRVHRSLGCGLIESAYAGAFCVELAYAGIAFEREKVFPLIYRGEYVGAYIADIVVDNTIILELKSVTKLNEVMETQLINYLKLSKIQVGYLMNFHNVSLEWKWLINSGG